MSEIRDRAVCVGYEKTIDWAETEISRLRAEVERLERKNRMHDTVNRDQAESYDKRLEAAEAKITGLRADVERLDAALTVAYMRQDNFMESADKAETRAEAAEQKAAELQGYAIHIHVLWLQGQLAGTDIEELMRQHGLNLQHKPTETDLTTKD